MFSEEHTLTKKHQSILEMSVNLENATIGNSREAFGGKKGQLWKRKNSACSSGSILQTAKLKEGGSGEVWLPNTTTVFCLHKKSSKSNTWSETSLFCYATFGEKGLEVHKHIFPTFVWQLKGELLKEREKIMGYSSHAWFADALLTPE